MVSILPYIESGAWGVIKWSCNGYIADVEIMYK
jgi:hypothetical protein